MNTINWEVAESGFINKNDQYLFFGSHSIDQLIRNRKVEESEKINENYVSSDYASFIFYVVNMVFQPVRFSGSFRYETYVK